uniref:Truncated OmpK35 n=1 Tax=Klebsiella pneumoniae TaxID=573 RepID=S5UDN3_KLEPN|nr:truncated OmpK35 [Klebsiella pneumoniae]
MMTQYSGSGDPCPAGSRCSQRCRNL